MKRHLQALTQAELKIKYPREFYQKPVPSCFHSTSRFLHFETEMFFLFVSVSEEEERMNFPSRVGLEWKEILTLCHCPSASIINVCIEIFEALIVVPYPLKTTG